MIQNAIKKHVKLTIPSLYAKRWWSSKLANEKKKRQQLGGRAKYHHLNTQHPIYEEYWRQCNHYSEMIWKAKTEHWVEWLEGIDESSIWQASRLVMSPATDAGKARIPTLQIKDPITKHVVRKATDNDSKEQIFYKTFFPPPNLETLPILQDYQYPPLHWTFTNITNDQIHRVIGKMKPYKATKSRLTPNSIFTHAREALVPYLGPLFRATYTLKFYPQEWVTTETLILKKPGKPDYTAPSAWWPIVLSDGMA